ncbi:hypothetical protein LZC95_04100 [Pendulispora brunnea]|uniref:Sigma-54 factor interaction domain-containing protein n=1 Tax=Pendulispora brunnea TaxID=2905690 RepID=A0ABZ2KG12_9BACT
MMNSPPPQLSWWRRVLARRALFPFVATVLYGISAAHRGEMIDAYGTSMSGLDFGGWCMAFTAIGLAVHAAWRTDTNAALVEWALGLVIASMAGAPAPGWADAFGSIGGLIACVAAARAMDAVEPAPSLASTWRRDRRITLAIYGGIVLFWFLAAYAHVVAALDADSIFRAHPRPFATTLGVFGGTALFAGCVRTGTERRFELGVAERFRASAAILAASVVIASVLAMGALVVADRAVRFGMTLASVLVVAVSLHRDAVTIARVSRLGIVLTGALAPVALLAALIASDHPFNAGWIACVAAIGAAFLGRLASRMAAGLRPARGAWLDAMVVAENALLRNDPEDALREVLVALREPAGPSAPSPELWTFDPMRVLRIDLAGYAHEKEKMILPELVPVASMEREAVLRIEVLDALEVRRPDLRPVLRWMDDRGALACVVVTRDGEPEGLLVLPRGERTDPFTLEEVRALKRLADRLAAACHSKSAAARARQRERDLVRKVEEAEEAVERLRHDAAVEASRHARATMRWARRATVGIYSPPARLAYDALERRAKAGVATVVVAKSGIDPIPYIARAHLAGARRDGPFVLVDGTAAREHEIARWSDPVVSPLALADGGALVLVDGVALPADVQRLIGQALAERRMPWETARPLDTVLVLTSAIEADQLLQSGRLENALVSRLADALDQPIELPRLRDRPEDVRAILTDRLAREGMRILGSPVGLEDAAFARLVEYPFPGEDAELQALVRKLVARCAAGLGGAHVSEEGLGGAVRLVIRAADIDALELSHTERETETGSPRPGIRLL